MQKVWYLLVPFTLLLAFSAVACIAGYAVFLAVDGQWPLRKVITRTTLIFLVLSIFPLARQLGLNAADLGFARSTVFIKQLLHGMGLGLLTLLPVLMVLYALDVFVVDAYKAWTFTKASKTLGLSLLLALVISLVEEPLFRGLLLAGLRQKTGMWTALVASSVYYASLHFLHSKGTITLNAVNWFSGFPLLIDAFGNLFSAEVLPAWIALFMVGMFLASLRTRIPQGLGICIGCHAAWVWQIKMTKAIFNPNPHAEYGYLVSSYDGVIGPLVSVWMLLAVAGYWAYERFAVQR